MSEDKVIPLKRSFIGKPEEISEPSLSPPKTSSQPETTSQPETLEQELARVKSELAFCLEANEKCIKVNEEHLALLKEKDARLLENNQWALQLKAYIDNEAVKLKNVAIAYHNINHQWNSVSAVRSRLSDLEKTLQSPIYGAPVKPVAKEKVDLVNGQGDNLDGTKRDNIVGRLDASTRIASAIAHGRVVDKNGNKR